MTLPSHQVADLGLSGAGVRRVDWAERSMPVLRSVRERFAAERPLDGLRVAACLHVTAETANLLRALRAGGASVWLAASNPLSTQDDTAAALVTEYGVSVHAWAGMDPAAYDRNLVTVLESRPHLLLDDGCDLVNTAHLARPDLLDGVLGGCEQTTTGVIRLRRMSAEGELRLPMVAVNDTATKRMFDNRYGTGQSTIDGILRATNALLAGRTVVVAGFGYCGRGLAERARGMGARVVVTEVDPVKALDAVMQGYTVTTMEEAAPAGDVFVTVTGNRDVVRAEHLDLMKDGAILANSGHFDLEIDLNALESRAVEVNRGVREQADEYVLADGRRLLLLSEGRLVNLGAAEGHPAAVMDLSFAVQALTTAWLARNASDLEPGVVEVPAETDTEVARLELAALGVRIDALTPGQEAYLRSWHA
ncbi:MULTISPECIES: adenosylhomocysteinase [Nocardiopsis]|uniref:Adenosylhomocysteinase n=1 Tax=Nocardiopsis dassonvillei (strain ATCC 23218 / DSM 43111 / CIP 107115 / JCM 7437 / KCTC 9190 / NBRC 14626 / NCTC 10488 / NRRL B-5397 / IMRU 509) TaxID=446468 RepID=D7B5Q9_NOCDD|nr:adenosylhomocysteinase [Nocardiopsis dassonvillei]ADH69152.1 adenosylhomocysteinase [Nocardiopsis dassonvillei subsp. dassonvillei DSM 43111]APC37187.1 adenosylhomocysteinase [Nocardiopsis dassonvillei]NKY82181.1 adenosylhomocysteinase [Nocardiopsis dassonvillei]VEI89661.1 Adenosylhomocysteinase [Nocardiopsis dassonvillei]